MNVLLLGARAPACLEWARAFNESGWHVIVADSLVYPLTRFSNNTHKYIRLPEPKNNSSEWVYALQQLVQKENINLIMPTCEEVFYLAAGMEKIDFGCEVLTSPFELLHQLHHKGNFAKITAGWPVEVPQTHLITNSSELQNENYQSGDWVFKPAYSRFASRTLIRPSVKELQTTQPSNQSPWVAQKFISGREHCSFSVLQQGKVIAHACYHPRYRVGRGSGIYFEVTQPEPVDDFINHFGAQTGYTGQVGFDFIEDEEGEFFVLECNPRATSGVHLFNDQRQVLVNNLVQKNSTSTLRPNNHPRMVSLAMLLFGATKYGYQKNFWKDYKCAQDVIHEIKDVKPVFAQIPGIMEISWRAINRSCNILEAATADIEWDGQPINIRDNS